MTSREGVNHLVRTHQKGEGVKPIRTLHIKGTNLPIQNAYRLGEGGKNIHFCVRTK